MREVEKIFINWWGFAPYLVHISIAPLMEWMGPFCRGKRILSKIDHLRYNFFKKRILEAPLTRINRQTFQWKGHWTYTNQSNQKYTINKSSYTTLHLWCKTKAGSSYKHPIPPGREANLMSFSSYKCRHWIYQQCVRYQCGSSNVLSIWMLSYCGWINHCIFKLQH